MFDEMKFLFNVNVSNNNTLINMLQYDLNNTRDFNLVVNAVKKTDNILSRNTYSGRNEKDLNKSDIDKYVDDVKTLLINKTVLDVALYKKVLLAFNDKKEDYFNNIQQALKIFSVENAVNTFINNLNDEE